MTKDPHLWDTVNGFVFLWKEFSFFASIYLYVYTVYNINIIYKVD